MGAPQWVRENREVTSESTAIYIKQFTVSKAYKIILNSVKKHLHGIY
jgi:hypothetical protein